MDSSHDQLRQGLLAAMPAEEQKSLYEIFARLEAAYDLARAEKELHKDRI